MFLTEASAWASSFQLTGGCYWDTLCFLVALPLGDSELKMNRRSWTHPRGSRHRHLTVNLSFSGRRRILLPWCFNYYSGKRTSRLPDNGGKITSRVPFPLGTVLWSSVTVRVLKYLSR